MSFAAVAVGVGSAVAGAAVSSALAPDSSSTSSAASAADPFAGQRAQYQTMLSNLISNPSSITSQPGYQFQLQEGLNGVNGSMASSGLLNSGNRATALEKYGSDYASTQVSNQELLLAQLAGANIGSPATAGTIENSANTSATNAASTVGSAVTKATSTGLTNLFNGSSGSTASSTTTGNNTYGFSTGASSDPSYGVKYDV